MIRIPVKKTLALTDVQLDVEAERGIFTGYACKWGGIDSYGDTILKGAFANTLKTTQPKMFFNHEWGMPIGKYPVINEDDIGLFVKGELTPDLTLAEDVYAALKHQTLDGLSIGGFLNKGSYTETEQGRTIHEWTALLEISPVCFPADSAARIDMASVKSDELRQSIATIDTIRDFERFLRDAGGLSKGMAEALVARAKTVFLPGEPDKEAIEAKAAQELQQRLTRFRVPASLNS